METSILIFLKERKYQMANKKSDDSYDATTPILAMFALVFVAVGTLKSCAIHIRQTKIQREAEIAQLNATIRDLQNR